MDEEQAFEQGWQDLLRGGIQFSSVLNQGTLLRDAYSAGWEAHMAYSDPPVEESDEEDGS